jgi:hypothetical protein
MKKLARNARRDREVMTSTDRKLKRLYPVLSSPGLVRNCALGPGDPVFQRRRSQDREAAAYWMPRFRGA